LKKTGLTSEVNIKMDIKYHAWVGVIWINLAQYIVKLQTFGNTVVNTRFHKTWGNWFTTTSLSRRTLHYGVNEEVNVDTVWTVYKSVWEAIFSLFQRPYISWEVCRIGKH
jgi:hypothetical protein